MEKKTPFFRLSSLGEFSFPFSGSEHVHGIKVKTRSQVFYFALGKGIEIERPYACPIPAFDKALKAFTASEHGKGRGGWAKKSEASFFSPHF